MTKVILDTDEAQMGDALNVYFQYLRDISRLAPKDTLKVNYRGGNYVVTRNATSVRIETK